MRLLIKKILYYLAKSIADNLFLLGIKNGFFRKFQFKMSKYQIGQGCVFGHEIYFRNFGNVSIGNNSNIGSFSKFWNYEKIEIGDNFLGAGELTLNTASHDIKDRSNISAPIKIGNNVWCGQRVTILLGVTIGDNVVVAAGSVVNKDIPSNTVYGGIPAKKIKDIQ
jgi:maltose O-acetyltransferase